MSRGMNPRLWDSPGLKQLVEICNVDLIPSIKDSDATISLVPTIETDVKFAVEVGLSLMLDKPIILLVCPGTKIPPKLAKIADELVEVDFDQPRKIHAAVIAAMDRLHARGLV